MASSASAAGCSVQRGSVDFPNPWFSGSLGPISLIAFHSSTVLQVGGTYFTLALPFYAPIIFCTMLVVVVWFVMKRRAHA
ncbi:MAG: hypothetical protein NT167_11380 [Verrucomicrobia bacterium]|nr:hypothetical protein [Verrucomicrobiota bacterium]